LSKFEKRKFTLPYFIEYFKNNILTKKFFKQRHKFYNADHKRCETTNILLFWNINELDDRNNDNNIDNNISSDNQNKSTICSNSNKLNDDFDINF
jgi:hypothetical protein